METRYKSSVVPDNTGTSLVDFYPDGTWTRYPVIAWVLDVMQDTTRNLTATTMPFPIVPGGELCDNSIYCLEYKNRAGETTTWHFTEDEYILDDWNEALDHAKDLWRDQERREEEAMAKRKQKQSPEP